MKNKGLIIPPISAFSSRQKWEDFCWNRIAVSSELVKLLIPPYERRHIVLRAAVVSRVAQGKRYKEIAEELWLSPQTISSIKKSIKESKYRSYRERGKTERKIKKYSSSPFVSRKSNFRFKRTKYGLLRLPRERLL